MYKIDTSSFETAGDFDGGMAALWRNIPAKPDVLGLNFGPKDFDSRRDHFQALDNLAYTYKSREEEILQYKALMEAWEDATAHLIQDFVDYTLSSLDMDGLPTEVRKLVIDYAFERASDSFESVYEEASAMASVASLSYAFGREAVADNDPSQPDSSP